MVLALLLKFNNTALKCLFLSEKKHNNNNIYYQNNTISGSRFMKSLFNVYLVSAKISSFELNTIFFGAKVLTLSSSETNFSAGNSTVPKKNYITLSVKQSLIMNTYNNQFQTAHQLVLHMLIVLPLVSLSQLNGQLK